MSKQKNTSFFKTHRVLSFTLILFLIVVPLVVIPVIYTINAVADQTVLFENKSNKAVKNQDVFDLDFKLAEIIEPNDNNEGGKYIFTYEIKVNPTVNTIAVTKINGQLSIRNDKFNSIAERELNVLKTTSTIRLVIPFNYNLNKTILPLIKPDGPYLYIKIDYIETTAGLEQSMDKTLIIKVPYDDSKTIVKPQ